MHFMLWRLRLLAVSNSDKVKALTRMLYNDHERRLDSVWEDFMESTVLPLVYRSDYTREEIREAMGKAFDDNGFEAFDEWFSG